MMNNKIKSSTQTTPAVEENGWGGYTISKEIEIPALTEDQLKLMAKSVQENLENEYIQNLENEHKILFPKTSNQDWLEIFPEAKSSILEKIKELEKEADIVKDRIKASLLVINKKSAAENQWFWREYIKVNDGHDLLKIKEKISQFKWMLNSKKGGVTKGWITEDVKQRALDVPIENIVNIKLRRVGKNLVGLCPFHNEKTPSFYIYTATNSFYCFGCQEGGNTIKLVRKYHGYSFKEAISFLTK